MDKDSIDKYEIEQEEENNLPSLKGTKKQVLWADEIREEKYGCIIRIFDKYIGSVKGETEQEASFITKWKNTYSDDVMIKCIEEAKKRLKNQVDAVFWIEDVYLYSHEFGKFKGYKVYEHMVNGSNVDGGYGRSWLTYYLFTDECA